MKQLGKSRGHTHPRKQSLRLPAEWVKHANAADVNNQKFFKRSEPKTK